MFCLRLMKILSKLSEFILKTSTSKPSGKVGGFTFDDKLSDDLRVSEEDRHPNTEGHKLIAELLYNFYERVKKYV